MKEDSDGVDLDSNGRPLPQGVYAVEGPDGRGYFVELSDAEIAANPALATSYKERNAYIKANWGEKESLVFTHLLIPD